MYEGKNLLKWIGYQSRPSIEHIEFGRNFQLID